MTIVGSFQEKRRLESQIFYSVMGINVRFKCLKLPTTVGLLKSSPMKQNRQATCDKKILDDIHLYSFFKQHI